MKALAKIVLIFSFFVMLHPVLCQPNYDDVVGSWQGSLDVGGAQLRLVFNISLTNENRLAATLDSPDQGANDIPMGEVSKKADSLRIEAPVIQGFYIGLITSDSTIDGEWHQAGRVFELDLTTQTEAIVLNRPQEPLPPYPYAEEEVVFENVDQGFSLAGTFTIPEGDGPFPALILISGSGSQNRDEELFGHKPFKVIADHLTREGVAVLRYDDRGVGSSGGSYSGSTSLDNAGDARSAIDFLLQRSDIDPTNVGALGHSEGGMIAFMLAAENKDLAFIISLAGPGVDGKSVLLDQSEYISRLSGLEESVLEDNRTVMGRVYEIMMETDSYGTWLNEVTSYTRSFYKSQGSFQLSDEEIDQIIMRITTSIPEPTYAWLRYFTAFDPVDYLGKITCPVLALNGEKDCQVLAKVNIPPIRESLVSSGNQNITAMILPGLNHLFQHCETGLPAEYGVIEETFDENTLKIISDWILKHL